LYYLINNTKISFNCSRPDTVILPGATQNSSIIIFHIQHKFWISVKAPSFIEKNQTQCLILWGKRKKSESWNFLPGRYFCVSDYHFCIATLKIFSVVKICLNVHSILQLFPLTETSGLCRTGKASPDIPGWGAGSLWCPEASGLMPAGEVSGSPDSKWIPLYPRFSLMVCSGNSPQYPLDRVPGASIPEACGPLHLQYHAKTAAAFPAGKAAAGLPGLSGSFRPGFLQGGCAHGEDEKLVRIAQPALPAPRLRGWWAGLTAWRGIPGAEKIGLSWYKGKKHAQRPDTGGGDLRCYFTRPYSISVRLWQRITSFSWS